MKQPAGLTWFLIAALVCGMAAMHSQYGALAGDGIVLDTDSTPRITLTIPGQENETHRDEDESSHLKLTIYPESETKGANRIEKPPHSSGWFGHTRSEPKVSDRTQDFHNRQNHEAKKKYPTKNGPHQSGPFEISGVKIVDIYTGRTMPIHNVDLRPTIERIDAGIKNPHKNDGTVYRNLSRKLPRKDRNYYREYVVPTHGIRGPGPQRLIIGERGETYYTPDHYETFVKVERE